MNPPTEISKKDILRLALARMGDGTQTWRYLKQLDIVRPPQKKVTFTITAEVQEGDTPNQWNTGQLGRLMYHGSRRAEIASVQDSTEKPDEDPNTGNVPVEKFIEWAKAIKRNEKYCAEFWSVVERELGVPRPTYPAVKVSFVLTPSNFEESGVDLDQELDLSTLRSVLLDLGRVQDYSVVAVNN